MQPVRPTIVVPGDRRDKIMARSGWIQGYGKGLVVWQFGFLPDSIQARAYKVSVDQHIWVLAKADGTEVAMTFGPKEKLPASFQKVLES